MKQCKNPECNKLIPETKIDSLGRHNTRTSDFCDNNNYCRNIYFRKIQDPDYYKNYYKNNKDKYSGHSKRNDANSRTDTTDNGKS